MKNIISGAVGVLVLFVLLGVGIAANSVLIGTATVLLALGLLALVAFGPERMGIGLMVFAMYLAPMNALRVSGNITVSDAFFVLGFGLLVPRMVTAGRPKLPPLYVIGIGLLFTGGMITSALAPDPAGSLIGFVKIIAAMMVLVFVMNLLRPEGRLLDTLVWAYVFGQITSLGYGLVKGAAAAAQGRSVGLTTQPNFYGLGGQMAYALLIFLFYRVQPKNRWIVVGAMGLVGFSVLSSGSRASLLCCAIVTIVWPIVERSAITWYVILTGALLGAIGGAALLEAIGQGNTLDRLTGNTSAQYSDQARTSLLHQGLDLFWKNPIKGNGWTDDIILTFHNAYLEVAVGGGVLTLAAFLIVIVALVKPLFDKRGPNRLAYAGLSYAAFGMIGPTLYDRIVWAALALILVAYEPASADRDTEPESRQGKANSAAAEEIASGRAALPAARRQPPRPRSS